MAPWQGPGFALLPTLSAGRRRPNGSPKGCWVPAVRVFALPSHCAPPSGLCARCGSRAGRAASRPARAPPADRHSYKFTIWGSARASDTAGGRLPLTCIRETLPAFRRARRTSSGTSVCQSQLRSWRNLLACDQVSPAACRYTCNSGPLTRLRLGHAVLLRWTRMNPPGGQVRRGPRPSASDSAAVPKSANSGP